MRRGASGDVRASARVPDRHSECPRETSTTDGGVNGFTQDVITRVVRPVVAAGSERSLRTSRQFTGLFGNVASPKISLSRWWYGGRLLDRFRAPWTFGLFYHRKEDTT